MENVNECAACVGHQVKRRLSLSLFLSFRKGRKTKQEKAQRGWKEGPKAEVIPRYIFGPLSPHPPLAVVHYHVLSREKMMLRA
jgi:hypothetical protein